MVKKKLTRKSAIGATPRPLPSIRSIRACSDKESLESEFKKYKMTKKQSMDFLLKAMGVSAISYSKGYPAIEERYRVIVGTYLSGVWKRSYSSWNQGES